MHSALGREDLHFYPAFRLVKDGCLQMNPEHQTSALALGWVARAPDLPTIFSFFLSCMSLVTVEGEGLITSNSSF